MLSRLALRHAAISMAAAKASARFAPAGVNAASFHSSASKQEEKKAVEYSHPGFLTQYGLDDWKISMPIIAAISIPAISNGFYVLNEETQLVCCFFLFGTSLYKFGGDAIALYFDARANAILSEHNLVEDANIALAKETLSTHASLLNIHEDIAAVAEAHKEAVALMCQVQAAKLRHKTRDTFVKNLESIREIESSYNLELQKSMVASATKNVRVVVEKGDKALKAAAFKHALDIISQADVDESKEDDIAALFSKELRTYAEGLEAKQGTVVQLTEAEQKELQADLDAYMKRFDLEDAEFVAPKEIKLELM